LISGLLPTNNGERPGVAHDGEFFAAAGGVVINPDIRKEALARIGR
jgi:hypothetical protein